MTYTSPTAINGTVGIGSLLEYINEVTNFWMSRMIMVAIFTIFFVGYIRAKPDEDVIGAFAVGSYATLVIGILFWIIGFLDGVTFGIIIGATIVSSALLFITLKKQ